MLSLLTGHNILFALTSGTLRPSMGARQIGVASGPHVGPVRSRPVVLLIAVIPLRVDLVAGGTPDRHGCNQRSTRAVHFLAQLRAPVPAGVVRLTLGGSVDKRDVLLPAGTGVGRGRDQAALPERPLPLSPSLRRHVPPIFSPRRVRRLS